MAPSEDPEKSLEDVEKSVSLDDDNNSAGDIESPPITQANSKSANNDAALTQIKSLEKRVSLPREIAVILVISLAQFTTQAGTGSMLVLVHVIGDHYNIHDPGVLAWLIAGFSLTVGTFILFSGRLGDVFGWKLMLIVGFAWYAVWSIVLGLSWYSNHVLFIFARVLQGIGPSICLPNALALLGGLYEPGMRKNMAFAIFGGNAPLGAVAGSVIGGLFNLTWWPWLFWFGGMCLALIAILAALVIPDPQTHKPGVKGKSWTRAIWDLDLIGAAVGIVSLILFNFAWNQAPIASWSSPYIIVTLVLGIVLIPVFFYIEIKVSPEPLLPLEIFTSDNAFVLGCVACGWANFGIWVYYLVQILSTLRGLSPLLLAAYLCPIAVSGTLAALTTGRLLGLMRPAWIMLIALCFFLIGECLVATLPPHQVYWAQIFVTTILAPWGMDMSFPSATIVVSNSVDKEHQGVAASLVNTIVNYSISLGLGFGGTVQVHVAPIENTPEEILRGYRAALYLGTGLVCLGLVLAITFLAKSYWEDHRKAQHQDRGADIEQ